MLIAEYDYATDIAVQRAEERKIAYTEGKSLGLAEGKSLGLAEGEARGRSEGSHQAKLETAKKSSAIWTFSGKDSASHRSEQSRGRSNS